MDTVIIDYGAGNLHSATKGLERAAAEAGYAGKIRLVNDADAVRAADRIVLPGDGAFGDCMAEIRAMPGLVEALDEAVIQKARPFLGICIGMQLMAERGLEHGTHEGLGWVRGTVAAMKPADPSLKIPHMGWNVLDINTPAHPVLSGLPPKPYAYFVHGYHLTGGAPEELMATTDHGGPVVAIVGRANMVGTQFHPEKSQAAGLQLLANFMRWRP